MKNIYTIKWITLLLNLIFTLNVTSQSNAERNYSITLDFDIRENNNHTHANYFKQQDEAYYLWLYALNKANEQEFWKTHSPKRLLRNSGPNNSLIFSKIYNDGRLVLDTVRNSLHTEDNDENYNRSGGFLGLRKFLAKFRAKHALKKQNLKGRLPEGCMSFVSTNRKGLKCGVQLAANGSKVKIELRKADQIIKTIVDDKLQKGWNNFEWKRGQYSKGMYALIISVDEHTMSQNVKL